MAASAPIQVDIPESFEDLYRPARYKVYYGGRGGAKSWNFARALVTKTYSSPLRVLCAREFQSSIADSVHRLLTDQIWTMGLKDYFSITKNAIVSSSGSEFLFKGFRHHIQEIKSLEGIDIVWIEEARGVSRDSLETLDPTIRKDGSEIWISYNPDQENDPVHDKFVVNRMPSSFVHKVGWEENPYFPPELERQRVHMMATDPQAYEWIWGGHCRLVTDAIIFRNRVSVETFDEPPLGTRFFYGSDFGFANDPTTLIRCWIDAGTNTLYVDHEAFGWGVEIDETAQLYDMVPASREWPIKGDGSRPETISYLGRQGFNITAAEKWPGSVEDGIAHLKGFARIVIHERCRHFATEARLYSFKIDKKTGDVLPIIVDKHNHGWDALRYSLDGYIQARGGLGVWAKLVN